MGQALGWNYGYFHVSGGNWEVMAVTRDEIAEVRGQIAEVWG
jgi:hypothetical protein